ncbi:MAG: Asp-tRNA(Asn)/Glu-tRNA(Gln) amidotransferase subunit GatB [Anaerolineales bacterium]|jgi:aspartyl-tRNA(Asn)/glutamyl-tRNA(Gln) amidotransferase subunit B
MAEFEPVIGLEIHAELATQSKMFCGCAVVDITTTDPNTSVCEVCTGMPGTLPVINQRAIEYALRVALALHCEIAKRSLFARKNYFYPDLPKGYQISQYELPLAHSGWLPIQTEQGEKRFRIRRVHMEEDTGKLIHRDRHSLIDYNRSGVPLLEIVSEPDLHSLDDVRIYTNAQRTLLRYLEVSSGDMEKGAIRFEANVSLRSPGSSELGTRTEIKNLNSFRSMQKALSFEIGRQTDLLKQGKPVVLETLGWDEVRGVTFSQRGKEEAHDYRYFPDPDLPPLHIDSAWVESLRQTMPELPSAKQERFAAEYGLTAYTVGVITSDREVADFFENAVASQEAEAEKIAHWLTGDFFALLNQAGTDIGHSKVSPIELARLVGLVERGEINATSGKVALEEMFSSGRPAAEIVQESGLSLLSDASVIDTQVSKVLDSHPEQVAQYLAGKKTLSNWFFGQVMSACGGRADPQLVRSSLQTALESLEGCQQDE